MLKRIAHILLGVLLIVATTGVTISKHYCGNQLLSVSIFKAGNCGCGDQCKDCHTNLKLVKVTDNFAASDALHPGFTAPTDHELVYQIEFLTFTFQPQRILFTLMKAPPPGHQDTLALLQSFRC